MWSFCLQMNCDSCVSELDSEITDNSHAVIQNKACRDPILQKGNWSQTKLHQISSWFQVEMILNGQIQVLMDHFNFLRDFFSFFLQGCVIQTVIHAQPVGIYNQHKLTFKWLTWSMSISFCPWSSLHRIAFGWERKDIIWQTDGQTWDVKASTRDPRWPIIKTIARNLRENDITVGQLSWTTGGGQVT